MFPTWAPIKWSSKESENCVNQKGRENRNKERHPVSFTEPFTAGKGTAKTANLSVERYGFLAMIRIALDRFGLDF